MYKIYINETPIFLTDTITAHTKTATATHLITRHRHRKALFQYIDSLEKKHLFEAITVYAENVEMLKADFFSIYNVIPAAGGVVLNEKNEALFIFRRGFWDLPKGKIEEGETIEEAAVREVREEVGLKNVEIIRPLTVTYHTYRDRKGQRCLKLTHWFLMKTEEQTFKVQTEEDIETAEWLTIPAFLQSNKVAYHNINDVIAFLK